MNSDFLTSLSCQEFSLWNKLKLNHRVLSFDLEVTARCNLCCRHCYINVPKNDEQARNKELNADQIGGIVDQAISLGAVWCLITGGEPLLRKDFFDIYLSLKKRGLLTSVFTNATLIQDKHIRVLKQYPPRDIEVTVYGVTAKTYESVTRVPGSFKAFMRGLGLLIKNNIKVRLKAMALRSNVHELPQIAAFCRKHTKDYFRFDPFLHLRFDRDQTRNEEIRSERLSAEEIVAIERADKERLQAFEKSCDKLILPDRAHQGCNHLFHCGAGNGSFSVSYDGLFRLCSSLWHPDCIYDLKKGTLLEAWHHIVPKVRNMSSERQEFLQRCHSCPIINLCIWCPAHSHLENGELDKPVDYFCDLAHAREKILAKAEN
jgi:radical SAM protein with 4Fe4S-binding SPASM domain